MKVIPGSRRCCHAARIGTFLTIAVLIAGMAGCGDGGYNPTPSENLEIRTWYDLDAVRDNLAGNHTLMNDLDCNSPGYAELASPTANEGKGWDPIGTFITDVGYINFGGNFDGQGYQIHDLSINRPDERCIGLFFSQSGVVKNIGVVNVTVTGNYSVGGLVGFNSGTVIDCYVSGNVIGKVGVGILAGRSNGSVGNSFSTGNVTGTRSVGNLAGINGGAMNYCYSTGSVSGHEYVGGLVGCNHYGTVSNSHSSAKVTGNDYVGGLVGCNGIPDLDLGEGNIVSDSYSTGSVSGYAYVGGLVGINYESYVRNSYSTSSVSGHEFVGGLVGKNAIPSIHIKLGEPSCCDWGVSESYASGNVTGERYVGGLVGQNHGVPMDKLVPPEEFFVMVSNSYSTGNVTGNSSVGGLVGWNLYSTVSDSFWDTQTSGQATSAGGTGKTTTEIQDITTFSGAGWDIIAVNNSGDRNPSYIWNIVDDVTCPFLCWQS